MFLLGLVKEYSQHRCLQVFRLWDFHGLQGDGGEDVVGALRYPTLGRPVEGGSLDAGLLQLRVAGRVKVHLRQLECDRPGRLLKAAEGSGHPVIDKECEGRPFITTVLRNASPVSSPVEAPVLWEICPGVKRWHFHLDGFSQVRVAENLLIPRRVVGLWHCCGVQLLCVLCGGQYTIILEVGVTVMRLMLSHTL